MVKIIYTWPDNAFVEVENNIYGFSKENNFQVDVPWDVVYALIRDKHVWMYMKFEWDPDAKVMSESFKPWIVDQIVPIQEPEQKIIVESNWKKEILSANSVVDELLEPIDTTVLDKFKDKNLKNKPSKK